LSTHYRKPMDWTEKKRAEAQKTLMGWLNTLQKHGYSSKMVDRLRASDRWKGDTEFMGALNNDLNTPGALARLHVLAKAHTAEGLAPMAHALETLGFIDDWNILDLSPSQNDEIPDWIVVVIDRLLEERSSARVAKNWTEADRLRDVLNTIGVQVTDIGGAATWLPGPNFDPSKLEALK
jgi:cysteinyl-tRNA synthetase